MSGAAAMIFQSAPRVTVPPEQSGSGRPVPTDQPSVGVDAQPERIGAVAGGGRLREAANYAAANAGTGNAVTDLIFSMANRDVTFFNATALMSFL
jgi:hypothetical protein